MTNRSQILSRLFCGGAVAAATVMGSTGVVAQTGPASGSGAAKDRESSQLGELVVTARKQKENIVRTPVAVTAITAQALESKGIIDLKSLGEFAPGFHQTGLTFGRADRGYESYTMRGIYGGDGQQRQPVQLFIDGVPISSGMIAGLDAVDRVELVKGPQSAYFGRSTFAGAVNFVTRTPSFTPHVEASADFASFGYKEIKAEAETGIIPDILSFRISGRYYDTDGPFKNSYGVGRFGAQSTKSVSGSLYFTPSPKLKIKLFGQYWQDRDGPSAQARFDNSYRNCSPRGGVTPTYICGQISSVPDSQLYWNTSFNQTVLNTLIHANAVTRPDPGLVDHLGLGRRAGQAYLTFEYQLPGDWTLSGNAGFSSDQYRIVLENYQVRTSKTYLVETQSFLKDHSGELRLQSPEYFGFVKGLVGVNYLYASVVGQAIGYSGSPTSNSPAEITAALVNASDSTRYYSETLGFFGSLHFDISSKLKFDVEGREQADKIKQSIVPDAFSVAGDVPVSAQKTFHTFTPKAILSYFVDPNTMVYGSYSKGSRPGQFNTSVYSLAPTLRNAILSQANVQLAVPPEKLDMYEIGLKSELFNRRLRVILDGYYGDWYDRQVTAPIYYFPPGSTNIVLVNAISGSSRVHLYGFEGELTFRATKNLTFEGTFDYAASNIRKTYCASCAALTGNGDPVGNTLPGYAPISGSASVNYARAMSDDLNGFVRIDYVYTGKQYEQEDNLAWTKPSNTVNARVGLQWKSYSIEVYGKNVFNNKAPTSVFTQTNLAQGGYTVIATPPQPATVGVRLGFKL